MRTRICSLVIALVLAGCAKTPVPKRGTRVGVGLSSTNAPIITRSVMAPGRIDSVNAKARFVVISFPIGTMPSIDTRLNVYRGGLKVGEVKVTLPQQNNFTAADIIAGDCRIGDEVRSD